MLYELITRKKNQWLTSGACPINDLSAHIRKQGHLRETQIEAIETYLYLKIEGGNKPLWKLFSENFFADDIDLNKLNINQETRKFLQKNTDAMALYGFSIQKQQDGKSLLPELEKLIIEASSALDYERIIRDIFYQVSYADYLMSLPMGAGKTFLMVAIIYLDLYFAQNEPDNATFAHNFLVLIPSGLKSSIAPSLRTIENFDPEWVIPNPAAAGIKRQLSFEILDEQKSAKSSNKVRNPNVQKVSQCFPNPFATVFVVNAEKVILDRLDLHARQAQDWVGKSKDERDRLANELRNWIGKIPHLSILIDEVHHAATDDIKLRQVVNKWQQGGNITTVLGFSGTPYLSKADRVSINEGTSVKFSQITNTVYYYPLIKAINSFLKKPQVKIAQGMQGRLDIIRHGIVDFQRQFGRKRYANGSIAKLAIYCSNIETLEEQVYPFLAGELKIPADEILKFHRGNKEYPQPPGSELDFRSLDFPAPHASGKRYILLVQVGKEGWDCRSLTGIILSQQGDCKKNMILQTSCRCLRQADAVATKKEEALVWLNDSNAKTLNSQLKQQQQTSIQEINQTDNGNGEQPVQRRSRIEQLELPALDFYQLKVNYQAVVEAEIQTHKDLQSIYEDLENHRDVSLIITTDFEDMEDGKLTISDPTATRQPASFKHWLNDIVKTGFHTLSTARLYEFEDQLQAIFAKITIGGHRNIYWNELYDRETIGGRIRLAFHPKRELQTSDEVIPETAELLLVDKLTPADFNDKLYPNEDDTKKILQFDDHPEPRTEQDRVKIQQAIENLKQLNMDTSHLEQQLDEKHSTAVKQRDKSFHYLPYNFIQSGLELELLQRVLSLEQFQQSPLEIYYNGERGLTGFVIHCFRKKGKSWQNIGRYTTDFLIIQRDGDKKEIRKVLMIETKGSGYADDQEFQSKKSFVENEFLQQNSRQFGYAKFDFLYLLDTDGVNKNITMLNEKITGFFG